MCVRLLFILLARNGDVDPESAADVLDDLAIFKGLLKNAVDFADQEESVERQVSRSPGRGQDYFRGRARIDMFVQELDRRKAIVARIERRRNLAIDRRATVHDRECGKAFGVDDLFGFACSFHRQHFDPGRQEMNDRLVKSLDHVTALLDQDVSLPHVSSIINKDCFILPQQYPAVNFVFSSLLT